MIVVGSWSFTLSTPEIQYWAYDAGPYLTWANNQDPSNSITVCWHSKWITGSKVRYGLTPYNMENIATSSEFDRYHKVPISDLISNTTYYYEVIGFGIKEFTTAPIGGHNYTFSVWSDPRTNGNIDNALKGANLPEIMHNQLISDNIKLAFSINAGDITHRGVDYRTWQLWLKDISTNDFASNASHQIAIGNHERHDDWGMRYFSLYYPYKNTSYSFDYGNVHFSILDRLTSNYPWYRGDGAQHAKWLEEDLISHSESKFKVLVMHNNPLRLDLDNGNNTLIMEVVKNYGVDVIFTGHNHEYETKYINGTDIETAGSINYVENIVMMIGIGGNSLDPTYAGYCRIDVTEDSMTLRPYWVNGTQIENPFVIQK
jgi:hypothetical protein